jgi:thioredoxin 1
MVTELNAGNFNAFTDGVVDFWATWCGPCRMIAPILDELAEENGLEVGKVNVDEESDIARAFGITAIPTLVILKGGKEAGRIQGYMPKAQLAAAIARAMA